MAPHKVWLSIWSHYTGHHWQAYLWLLTHGPLFHNMKIFYVDKPTSSGSKLGALVVMWHCVYGPFIIIFFNIAWIFLFCNYRMCNVLHIDKIKDSSKDHFTIMLEFLLMLHMHLICHNFHPLYVLWVGPLLW